jgi:hypothetical protein
MLGTAARLSSFAVYHEVTLQVELHSIGTVDSSKKAQHEGEHRHACRHRTWSDFLGN